MAVKFRKINPDHSNSENTGGPVQRDQSHLGCETTHISTKIKLLKEVKVESRPHRVVSAVGRAAQDYTTALNNGQRALSLNQTGYAASASQSAP
jgi:hypothetical protein